MAYVKVASAAELEREPLIEVFINGNPYALCKVGLEIFAVDGVCPHQGGPLGQGSLEGTTITCPWHAWEFDCRTGASGFDASESVPTFAVRVEHGDVLIDLA